MFSKGVVLIFLLLGLSSSIAHAIPHQNRAQPNDPCEVRLFSLDRRRARISHHIQDTPSTSPAVLVSTHSPPTVSKNTTTDKSSSKKGIPTSCLIHGTVLIARKKAATFPNQGTLPSSEKEARPQSPATTRTVQILRAMAKTVPQSVAIRMQILKAITKMAPVTTTTTTTIPTLPSVSISLASRKCLTHLLQGLDQSVLSKGSQSDGLNNATAGTSASLTSTNNFINFCIGKTITSGQQVKTGSCNPIPMGVIASANNIPSSKFVSPTNLGTLKANTAFTMKLAVKNVQLGVFTNPDTTYFAAPQGVNKDGNIIGHTHLVAEQVESLTSTTPLDPTKFAFFKGIDGPADADGTVSADVTNGLPEGVYRLSSIGTGANHASFLVAIAQHGSTEDAVYVGRSPLLEYENQLLITIAILFFLAKLSHPPLFLKFFRSQ